MNRTLVGVVVGSAAAAGALWGASALSWQGPAPTWVSGVALLALAGIAGVLATAGPARRAVGGLLALAGLAVAVAAVAGHGPGSWVGLAGGLLLTAAAVPVLVRESALPRFGSRYARTRTADLDRDPDRAAWEALDDGRDPTT